jgi:hypothetical protein
MGFPNPGWIETLIKIFFLFEKGVGRQQVRGRFIVVVSRDEKCLKRRLESMLSIPGSSPTRDTHPDSETEGFHRF